MTSPPATARRRGDGIGDSVALTLTSAFNSVAGLLGVVIAAWVMPQAEVGRATEFVSAMQLIGGAAQLNLGIGIMRWLPGAGRKSVRLVFGTLLLVMPLSGLAGLVYGLVVPRVAEVAAGDRPFAWGLALLVLACAGWGVFVVHDYVLVATGRPWLAVWRGGTFALTRVVLLGVLGAAFAAEGMVLSWAIPVVLWTAAGTVLLWVVVRRFAAADTDRTGDLPSRRTMVAFLAPTAIAQFGAVLLYNQIPLLANFRMGNAIGAVFFVAWQATVVVDTAAVFFTNSLAVATAREPHRAAELARLTRRRMLLVFVPLLALGALLGGPVLGVLGAGYAVGAPIVAALMVGVLFRLVVVFELARRQADGDGTGFARLALLNCGLVVLFAWLVPLPVPGTVHPALVMLPFVIGYVLVQAGFAVYLLLRDRRIGRRPVS
ncbi:lipopolysaccharide biosynthesis protein [Pseudonocardia sp. HH130630-07]|uniref:lipopolysaccharide biosynthesis protein n=1 Tax=Pseudonocardia sp. HH130630-07 TaxID=1690815 RepID=UPI000814C9E0|nr:hypothetical protein [Pseudonocardia sp. HH130630-07]ANY07566.1 hypothetical protein AFB00_16120 [Pseudonocardia sp. HH130630-07]